MPVPQDTRIQSDDPGESIIVLQKEASAEFPSPPPFRTSRPFVIMEPRHEIEERDEYEVTLSPKPRPQLSIPNWNAHRESNGESSKSYEAAKPNRYFPPQETTSDASRGRKRKAMSDEDKQRANLVRRLGACPNCRRRKLACSPSHDRGDGGRSLKLALATYQKTSRSSDVTSRPIPRPNSAEREFISDSTTTSLYEEPITKHPAKSHRALMKTIEPSIEDKGKSIARSEFAFETDPSSISDVDIRNRHTKLRKFGQSLNQAAKSTFPITSPLLYTSVHVLLLRWKDDDLGVSEEADQLAKVFSDSYHFEVTTGLIPSDSPSRWLSRKILNFVELEDDSRQTLKIVWYGGHSFISDSNQCMWSSDYIFSSTVSWQGCQSLLEEAQSDVLILLDACGAGNGSTSAGNGCTEVITAGGWYGDALPDVGAFSFTSTLTTELRLLSSRESFTIDQLYQHMLARIQSQLSSSDNEKRRNPTPFHFITKRESGPVQSITLCPLQDSLMASVRDIIGFGRDSKTPGAMEMGSDDRHPGIALRIRLKDEYSQSELATDQFMEWLRAIPVSVEQVKVEAGYAKF